MIPHIRPLQPVDHAAWNAMRRDLWPDDGADELDAEAATLLERTDWAIFVAIDEGDPVGFLECSLREAAPGCTTSPIAYVEGWYMRPLHRRQGIGRRLVDAAARWGAERGCREMASDTTASYPISPAAHAAAGFEESAPFRYRRSIDVATT